MKYRDLIEAIEDIANELRADVNESQVINFSDEIEGEDDTIIFRFTDLVEELMANATGHHGWSVQKTED